VRLSNWRIVVLCVLGVGALLAAVVAVVRGTRPYDRPVIAAEPGGQDASFDGISQQIADARQRGTMLHVLWVHGMCTHESNWAADRATRIATALGGAATQTGTAEEPGGLTRILYHIDTGSGDFDATFVLWSAMTRAFKRTLDFDSPGQDRTTAFPYKRATLNGTLKTALVNDCLSDAVVYSGRNGDPIRAAMKQAVCRELGGKPLTGEPCDLTDAPPARPLVVITESLGSKVLFDAARAVYHDPGPNPGARHAMNQRFASVKLIFLMANQIPLLDIASPMGLPDTEAVSDAAQQTSSLGDMIGMVHLGQMAMAADRAATMAPPTVVAFTDPNDLLSYRLLPPVVDLARARLINVIASNAATWLGFLERPDIAHCGYTLNRTVIGLIARGHKVGEALPEAPVVESSQCF
jgi:hypothetical protein